MSTVSGASNKSSNISVNRPPTQFYVVYLLHSPHTNSHYIGSTPDPQRRLNQHNGHQAGGAKKTARSLMYRNGEPKASCRPWEMCMFVHGFMDQKSALRFEWALQHPYESKDFNQYWDVVEWRGQRKRKGSSKSLRECIMFLNLLLQCDRWCRYPLRLHIFTDCKPSTMTIMHQTFDQEITQKQMQKDNWLQFINWKNVVFSYGQFAELRNDLIQFLYYDSVSAVALYEKLLDSNHVQCICCKNAINVREPMTFLTCRRDDCKMIAHLPCLACIFLKQERTSHMIPKYGSCCECGLLLWWADLIRGLNVRVWYCATEREEAVSVVSAAFVGPAVTSVVVSNDLRQGRMSRQMEPLDILESSDVEDLELYQSTWQNNEDDVESSLLVSDDDEIIPAMKFDNSKTAQEMMLFD